MSEAELIFTALAELSTRQIAESVIATGMEENESAGKKGGKIAGRARLEFGLAKWAIRKFKRLHRKLMRALRWLSAIAKRESQMFAHWSFRRATAVQQEPYDARV